jgi:hypothetical protein
MFSTFTGAERFEKIGLDLFGNPTTRVLDHDLDLIVPDKRRYNQFFGGGLFHGLDGILNQVRKRLGEIEVISLKRGQWAGKGFHDLNMVFEK